MPVLPWLVVLGTTGGCTGPAIEQNNPPQRTELTDSTEPGDVYQSTTATAHDAPSHQNISDFSELSFSLNTQQFDVHPESASRKVWPDGYQLETATWRGQSGSPMIMINVLDIRQSGESFSNASSLMKSTDERVRDLIPGQQLTAHATGAVQNAYGACNYQTFTVDERTNCAFVNQVLGPELADDQARDRGQIIVEALYCENRTGRFEETTASRLSQAYRIGKPDL